MPRWTGHNPDLAPTIWKKVVALSATGVTSAIKVYSIAMTIWPVPPILRVDTTSTSTSQPHETKTYKKNRAPNHVTQRGITSDSKTRKNKCISSVCEPEWVISILLNHLQMTTLNPTFNVNPNMPRISTGFRPQRSEMIPYGTAQRRPGIASKV